MAIMLDNPWRDTSLNETAAGEFCRFGLEFCRSNCLQPLRPKKIATAPTTPRCAPLVSIVFKEEPDDIPF
jgi:hypothetical protein